MLSRPQGIVDSHQHFWRVGAFPYPWMPTDAEHILRRDYLPDELAPQLERCGVSRTVLVQASNSVAETDWMLRLSDAHPFIAGVVGWVDLNGGSVGQQLNELQRHERFKGVRHLVEGEPDDDWIVRPEVLESLRELARHGLNYDLLVRPHHLKHVARVADAAPDLRLTLDHLAKPPIASGAFDEWARQIETIARIENLYCKLSGLVTEARHDAWTDADLQPYADHALRCFGARRVMFGSDYPVCLLAADYARVIESCAHLISHLSEEDGERIFSRNAQEFYRL